MSTLGILGRYFSTHPLTRDAPLEAWARFVSWQVRSRIQDEVIFFWVAGQKLVVRRGMCGATCNIYAGLHEFTDMMLPLHFLREGDLFLDIGSNIGSYTVLASGACRATTWAFEPDPDAGHFLKRNIELNGLNGLATVYELALGDTDGEVSFTQGLGTVNRVATDAETHGKTRTVPVRRLDTLIGSNQPAMIKMDVEGYEEAVVRGAKNLIAGDSLKVVEIETLTPQIADIFDNHGFKRAYYEPFRRALTTSPNDLPASNSVFVRDWDFVATRLMTAPAIHVLGRSI